MNRREALSSVALLLGGTILGAEAFLSGCKNASKDAIAFTPTDIELLSEIAETILPATSTPGAKDAKVGEFMALIVKDCYTPEESKAFTDGMKKIEEAAKAKYGKTFVEATKEQRHDLLVTLDSEAKAVQKNLKEKELPHYFAMMKQLTLWGFFTSEVGATKALRYVAVPGKYDGNFPYKKGDRAWATS